MATGSPYRHQLLCSIFFFFFDTSTKHVNDNEALQHGGKIFPRLMQRYTPISSLSLFVFFSNDIYEYYISLSFFSSKTFFCRHTSTSRRPSGAPGVVMLMSKQVTIMTWDLHRLTQNSSSSVACAKASKYSEDSLSKLWSTSTVGEKKNYLQWPGSCREGFAYVWISTHLSYLHSPSHLFGSIISRNLVSSNSSNNLSCLALRSLTCCCLLSSIFSLLLKYCSP